MTKLLLGALFLARSFQPASAFSPSHYLATPVAEPKLFSAQQHHHVAGNSKLWLSDPKIEVFANGDDDDLIAPNKMRVSEIKAELDLRGISYADCFDKESLAARLDEARVSGKADPKILEKFNRQKLESDFSEKKVEIKEEDIDSAVANDGTLPGGLTPDQFKKLTGNPEVMQLLQSTKMQEAMTLMMSGGREELEKKLKEDPELQETVAKLDEIMKSLE